MRVLKSQRVVGVRNLDSGVPDSRGNMESQVVVDDLASSPVNEHVGRAEHTKDTVCPSEDAFQKESLLSERLAESEKRLQARDSEFESLLREHEDLKREYKLQSDMAFESQKSAGYEKGIESGRRDGFSETDDIRRCLGVIYKTLEEDFQASIIKQQPLILELVFSIVTKILGEKYHESQLIVDIINKNINALRLTDAIKIIVSPADFKIVSNYLRKEEGEKFLHEFNLGVSNVVECGGCIIETDAGGLDARLDVQLAELRKIFCASYG